MTVLQIWWLQDPALLLMLVAMLPIMNNMETVVTTMRVALMKDIARARAGVEASAVTTSKLSISGHTLSSTAL